MVWGCNSVGRVFAYHGQSSAGVAIHTCSLAAGGGRGRRTRRSTAFSATHYEASLGYTREVSQ